MKREYLYAAMYRAMDSVYDRLKEPSEELSLFLSDANPYIWLDRTAADPALQSEFEATMDRQKIGTEVDAETAYRAVKNFLGEQSPHYASLVSTPSCSFVELFEEITPEEWAKIYTVVADEKDWER